MSSAAYRFLRGSGQFEIGNFAVGIAPYPAGGNDFSRPPQMRVNPYKLFGLGSKEKSGISNEVLMEIDPQDSMFHGKHHG